MIAFPRACWIAALGYELLVHQRAVENPTMYAQYHLHVGVLEMLTQKYTL